MTMLNKMLWLLDNGTIVCSACVEENHLDPKHDATEADLSGCSCSICGQKWIDPWQLVTTPKEDPNKEETEIVTMTVRLPRAMVNALRRGEPHRIELVPAVPAAPAPSVIADPGIQDKPKRPIVTRESASHPPSQILWPSRERETEGFRKVTADLQAHMKELVEDCEG